MPIVGLTGSFGTGKSFAASVFKRLGAKIVDADKLAHRALAKGSAAYRKAVREFGKAILTDKGEIDRKALAGIVFKDKGRLEKLNRIIHPGVIKKIKELSAIFSKNEVVIIDAPLICETELIGFVDWLIVVRASTKKQAERCVKKFGMKKCDVYRRTARQMPLSKKVRMADYIIDNNGTKKDTVKQIREIWRGIKKEEQVWR